MPQPVASDRSVFRRIRIAVLSALVAISAMFVFAPAPAHAAIGPASGCSAYTSVQTPWIPIPAGWECFTVYGQGTSISSMRATWRATNLCNWRMDWVIYYGGGVWWRDQGPAHNHCDYVSGERTRGAGWGPAGSEICAELYNTSRNVKIEAVCLNITN